MQNLQNGVCITTFRLTQRECYDNMLSITYKIMGTFSKCLILMLIVASLSMVLIACAYVFDSPKILLEGEEIEALSMFTGQELLLSSDRVSGVNWASSDDAVVTVEADGYVRARNEGTATVTLTATGLADTLEITVTPYISVEEVKTVSDTLVIKAGGQKIIDVEVFPENASDPSLTYEILPADGILTLIDGVLTASEDAISGANYEIVITNPRSAVSATVQVIISEIRGLTAWTIGDSIFDFRDNFENDMVQSFLKDAGYVNFCMDNIAGATVRAASGVGVIEHIQNGMYDAWEEPDLIVLFRGTNDGYFGVQQPHFFTPESIEKAIEDTCIYFSENYPDARIVWATPLWRADVVVEKVDWIRSLIHTYCAQYGIEVFDLHLTEDFVSLSHENFGAVLYDGIHLTDLGANYLKDAFVEYLTK